jgi:glycosyl transferase family 92
VTPYLSIAAIYRNEAPYLREWIEFHKLVGVERFFLYNNESTDDHMEVLAPYIDEGLVVWEDFPGFPPQLACYQHCIETHRHDARWMAYIDVDEFLFSPTGRRVPEILRDYEEFPGVAVNCLQFGTSGHQTPPAGLVIENYTRRLGLERKRSKVVKAVTNPERVVIAGKTAHYFIYEDRVKAVNERREPVRGEFSDDLAVDLLRINHYFTRSQEERDRKLAIPKMDTGRQKKLEGVERRDAKLNEAPDETILMYADALRGALGLDDSVGAPAERRI